uniref:Uncharacterized protein n=1 Tax=Rhizophagus irregularis (strain DAOM 181602 / DAOM 197198 / MUCL 43194) TaxID=747089 RepID=U9TDU3_RHIID
MAMNKVLEKDERILLLIKFKMVISTISLEVEERNTLKGRNVLTWQTFVLLPIKCGNQNLNMKAKYKSKEWIAAILIGCKNVNGMQSGS